MIKISATIITLNEEKRIGDCLESLSWVDEIVIIDSGSTDKTVEICKKYTDKIFDYEWLGFGKQKNLCAEKASNDWILNIDADEQVCPSLQNEIKELLVSEPAYTNYKVPRKNYVNGKWIKHGGWYPDFITRLYNKKKCNFNERCVHEAIETDESFKVLKGHLEHFTYADFADYFSRINKYSALSVQEMMMQNKQCHWHDIVLRPLVSFIKNYFIKAGFLDGYYGLVLSCGYSFYTFQKYARLWERNK